MEGMEPWAVKAAADAAVQRTAEDLGKLLVSLASSIKPFPPFLGMASIQAVEVEPAHVRPVQDHGCVVVCPDGGLYSLELTLLENTVGEMDGDHVEQFKPLELSTEEYVQYAYTAINALAAHTRR